MEGWYILDGVAHYVFLGRGGAVTSHCKQWLDSKFPDPALKKDGNRDTVCRVCAEHRRKDHGNN